MTQELAIAQQQNTQQASPVVWILTKGEMHEGGHILGVYATKDAARDDFLIAAASIPFEIDKAWKDDDTDAVHVEGGCDFVDLEPHTVFTAPQLTA